jgi:hypothetical protein
VQIERKGGGYGQSCPSSSSQIQNRNRGGGAQGRPAGGGRRSSWAWRRPGVGRTERGGRRRLVPVLTSGWGGLWREIDGGGRSVTGAACGGRRWELGGERGKSLEVRGEVASDVGLFIGAGRRWRGREPRTRSLCLPVNGGSGSSAGGIRDGESTRRDDGAVGQDPAGSDGMDSEPGQRQARGGRRLAAATHWWPAMVCLRGLACGTRDGVGDEAAAWSCTRGLARRAARWGDGMTRRVRRQQLSVVLLAWSWQAKLCVAYAIMLLRLCCHRVCACCCCSVALLVCCCQHAGRGVHGKGLAPLCC